MSSSSYPTSWCNNPKRPVSSTGTWNFKSLFLLLRIYLLLIILYSSFIVSCWCMIDFLMKKWNCNIFIIFEHPSPWIHHSITLKSKGNGEYCSGLNFGAKNSKNMAVFTTGSWSCSQSATQPGRQYCHIHPLYISIELIRVYHIDILPLFPSWNLTEGFLPWKCHVSSVLFQVITEIQTKWVLFCVVGFYKFVVVWCRKLILNYFLLH